MTYLIFAWDEHNKQGGVNDLQYITDDAAYARVILDEVMAEINSPEVVGHIYDVENNEIIYEMTITTPEIIGASFTTNYDYEYNYAEDIGWENREVYFDHLPFENSEELEEESEGWANLWENSEYEEKGDEEDNSDNDNY